MRPARRRQRGSIMVIFALGSAAFIGAAGLALDLGYGFYRERAAQTAVDAAALAAAFTLSSGGTEAQATTSAQQILNINGLPATDLSLTYYDGSGAVTSVSNQVATVKGSVSDTFPTYLMTAVGRSQATAATTATATVSSTGRCVLCVMNLTASGALAVTGLGSVAVVGGPVVVDSNSSSAAKLTGSGNVIDLLSGTSIVGGYQTSGLGGFLPGNPTTGVAPVPDPLASVPVPSVSGTPQTAKQSGTGTMTISPGIYDKIDVSGSGSIVMNPGVYVITTDMTLSGGGSIVGAGVMLYFACSAYPSPCAAGQSGGKLDLTGNGSYTATAPLSGTYQGMSIFYDRNNSSSLAITGNGSDLQSGTIYARSGKMSVTGNGSGATLNALIEADTVSITGNGSVAIAYLASQNVTTTGLPALIQ